MKIFSSKALGLGAATALLVVGGGIAHADWQPYGAGTLPPISVAEAKVETPELVAEGAPSITYAEKDSSGTGTSTQRFIWVPDGTTVPYQSRVRLNSTVSWPHPIIVNGATRGYDRAYCLFVVSETAGGTDPAFGVLEYSAFWNGQLNFSNEPDLSSVNRLSNYGTRTEERQADNSLKYYLNASFNLIATNKARIRSETGSLYRGPRVNYFVAQATSGATTMTPTSIQVVP